MDEVLVIRQWYGSPSRNDGADTGWTKTDSRGVNRCVTWESNPNLEPFLTGQSFRVALKTNEKKKNTQRHTHRYTHNYCFKRNARVCPHQQTSRVEGVLV